MHKIFLHITRARLTFVDDTIKCNKDGGNDNDNNKNNDNDGESDLDNDNGNIYDNYCTQFLKNTLEDYFCSSNRLQLQLNLYTHFPVA